MNTLEAVLYEEETFQLLREELQGNAGMNPPCITGCTGSGQVNFISAVTREFSYQVIVTFSEQRAKEIYDDYLLYDKNVCYYPAKDFIFFNADIHGNLTLIERLKTIKRIVEGEDCVIVTTIDGLMDRLVPLEVIRDNLLVFRAPERIDFKSVQEKLNNMGYERVSQVSLRGQYAVRGEILDIFPVTEEAPVRIDLWDDEIDSIKIFDPDSQRSIEAIEQMTVYPATEYILETERLISGIERLKEEKKQVCKLYRSEMKTEEAHRLETIIDELIEQLQYGTYSVSLDSYINYFYEQMSSLTGYLKDRSVVYVLDEPARLGERSRQVEKEFRESTINRLEKGYILAGQMEVMNTYEQILADMLRKKVLVFNDLSQKQEEFETGTVFFQNMKSITSYQSSFELLIKDLRRYKKKGYKILLLTNSRTRAERLAENLRDYELEAFYQESLLRQLKPREIMVSYGNLHSGFEYPEQKLVVITQSDIFGREKAKKRRKKTHYTGSRIQDFAQLSIGDYVVHENHGLGIYRGIEQIEVDHVCKDYIKIEYADNSHLYILATQLDVIQKYADSDAKVPKINKLGTQEWTKAKTKVKTAVKDIAKDLVEIYAARQNSEGFQFGEDTVWQREFEETFPYEETYDQLTAIEETKKDMESHKIMDRLICGDVGYGKTEIAIRAAFKAVMDGKQVAVLVPTTILAQQHYNTFLQRMKEYPVKIEMLSRFRTPAGVKAAKEGLKNGKVDIVIGTHKLLGKDIVFKDLGLLVVDEEQRFGVTHKEKIKQLKKNIDVLTLTATPIPRTLHMSLAGIRDMSVLEEPPVDRLPIQTYVMEYDDEMVREAINRELVRGGQVYYVYNRVNNIEEIASHIAKMVGDAKVVYAHGQMNERKLEQIMYDFVEGEIDVLVATTIIETGLDIPNVNTIIIHDADNFGLSQLYQLRGRVGRSSRTSYAFLMYKRDKLLRETAEKRLHAIREFTELGSGFKIAMRDLEIRGAGNVLGAEQHGHMLAVGYDLYCKLLNEAVLSAKGEKTYEDFETKIDLNVDAYIPDFYIKNETQKINVYKEIAAIETEEDYSDMIDELTDRFGDIPKNVLHLMAIAMIRAMAHKAWITEISEVSGGFRIYLYEKVNLHTENIPALVEQYSGKLRLVQGMPPYFMYVTDKKMSDFEAYRKLLKELILRIDSLAAD